MGSNETLRIHKASMHAFVRMEFNGYSDKQLEVRPSVRDSEPQQLRHM